MIKYLFTLLYVVGSILLMAKLAGSNDATGSGYLGLFVVATALFLLPVALVTQAAFALLGRQRNWSGFTIILPTMLYLFTIPYAILLYFMIL